MTTIEQANAELRRLTPGWKERKWGEAIVCFNRHRALASFNSHNRPSTQVQLLVRLEEIQPWSQEVAIEVCRTMLVGWTEIGGGGLFLPPDGVKRPIAAFVELHYDAPNRLACIQACEKALRLYAERQAASAPEWPGMITVHCCACGTPDFLTDGCLCSNCELQWLAVSAPDLERRVTEAKGVIDEMRRAGLDEPEEP